MPGTSNKTKVVAVRLLNEDMEVVERRASKLGISQAEYIRGVLHASLSRVSHHPKKR